MIALGGVRMDSFQTIAHKFLELRNNNRCHRLYDFFHLIHLYILLLPVLSFKLCYQVSQKVVLLDVVLNH